MTSSKPLYEQLHTFAVPMRKAQGIALASALEGFKRDLEDVTEAITDFVDSVELWVDEEADRTTRRDAHEAADSIIDGLMFDMGELFKQVYGQAAWDRVNAGVML